MRLFFAFGIVLLVPWLISTPASSETTWVSSHRASESDPDLTVFAISRTNESGSATISIERSEAEKYFPDHFAKTVLSFGRHVATLLEEQHENWTWAHVFWSVKPGEKTGSWLGWWDSGAIHLIAQESQLDAWRNASTLSFYIDSPIRDMKRSYIDYRMSVLVGRGSSRPGPCSVGRPAASFDLDGLAKAFTRVALEVPATEEQISRVGGEVSNPVSIRSSFVRPIHPARALEQKIVAEVSLLGVIRADGSVCNITVMRCNRPGFGFEEAAMDAVRQWRYKPATKDGHPVPVYFSFTIGFKGSLN